MKVINVREAREQLAELIDAAQSEPVCLTRHGKPVAVLSGVEGVDMETVVLQNSKEFWTMIEGRRASKRPLHSAADVRKRFGLPAKKKA